MKKIKNTLFVLLLVFFTSCITSKRALTSIPEVDNSPPTLTRASLSVLGVGGYTFDLNRYETIRTINVDQALSLIFNAKDEDSGVESIHANVAFTYNCGVGTGTERTWRPPGMMNTEPAEPGAMVRVAAGVNRIFSINEIYRESGCDLGESDTPPIVICTITVTATNYKDVSGSEPFRFILQPTRGPNDLER